MADELTSDEIKLQREQTTFKCAHCGELVSGEFMTAQHAGAHEMPVVFISCEDACPACGQPMARGRSADNSSVPLLRYRYVTVSESGLRLSWLGSGPVPSAA